MCQQNSELRHAIGVVWCVQVSTHRAVQWLQAAFDHMVIQQSTGVQSTSCSLQDRSVASNVNVGEVPRKLQGEVPSFAANAQLNQLRAVRSMSCAAHRV